MYQVWEMFDKVLQKMNHLSPLQWGFVAVGVLIVGTICLRGINSRTNL